MAIKIVKSSEYKNNEFTSSASMTWNADLDTNYSELLSVAESNFSTKKMFMKCLDDALRISLIEFCNANIKDTNKQMPSEVIDSITESNFATEKLRRDFHKIVEPEDSSRQSPAV